VELGFLVRKVKRDLLRSPAKAAVLAALLLVAIWFWAPLVKRWLTRDPDSSAEAVAVAQAVPVENKIVNAKKNGSPTTGTNDRNTRSWSELLTLIEQDQRTKSARLPGLAVHPFTAPQVRDEPRETADRTPTLPVDLDPKELGSTIVGPRSRLAGIDGKVCRAGQTIRVAYTGTPQGATIVEYRLEEIQSTYVTLSRGGRVYRLPLQRRHLADDLHRQRVVEERREG
jgi:hypothetical protein